MAVFCGALLSGAASSADSGKLIVSATWLPGHASTIGELFVSTGSNSIPVPITVGSNGRGRDVLLEGGGGRALTFLSRDSKAAQNAQTWSSLGEVALPSGKAGRYLLVLASQSGAKIVRGVAMVDDVDAFPVGSIRLANLTGVSLMAKIGDSAASYAAGFSAPLPYPVKSGMDATNVSTFPFALATERGVFFNGRIDAWPGSRTLVLIAPNLGPGKDPVVKSLIDRPTPLPLVK